MKSLPCLIVLASLIVFTGCGESSPFEYVPVTGRLTYDDGTPIPASGMKVQFEPLDLKGSGNMHARVATGDVDAQGNVLNVTSYKFGDGLVAGRHKVAIGYATDKNGKLLVPQSCTSLAATELVVDTATLPFEVKVPKP